MIKSTIKRIHHTLYTHVNNINQHLFRIFQTYLNTQGVNIKIQYNILKYTHNHNYHIITYFTKLGIQTSPNSTTITRTHITITTIQHSTVTQCKTCDFMHAVPQCEPKVSPLSDSISRIQATLRSGQDQSHYAYFQLRINVYMDPTFHHFHNEVDHAMNECTHTNTYAINIISTILTLHISP
jgi:hypothetical protein